MEENTLMSRLILCFALCLPLSFSASVNAGWFEPDNFDDCILDNMKGVQAERAAASIYKACRSKFPKPSLIPVSREEAVRLQLDKLFLPEGFEFEEPGRSKAKPSLKSE